MCSAIKNIVIDVSEHFATQLPVMLYFATKLSLLSRVQVPNCDMKGEAGEGGKTFLMVLNISLLILFYTVSQRTFISSAVAFPHKITSVNGYQPAVKKYLSKSVKN